MDFRTDEEKEIDHLHQRVLILEECVEMLCSHCACSIPERMSGHLVDCMSPHVRSLLNGDPKEKADTV